MTLPDPEDLARLDIAAGIQQLVVGAVIDDGGNILLLRRPIEDFRGGTWELPSGKTELGEDLLTALHREVTEETGLTIEAITDYLGAFDYTSGSGKHTRQHTWAVTVTTTEEVQLTEHDAHTWANPDENHPVSTEVAELLGKHARIANR